MDHFPPHADLHQYKSKERNEGVKLSNQLNRGYNKVTLANQFSKNNSDGNDVTISSMMIYLLMKFAFFKYKSRLNYINYRHKMYKIFI